MRYFANTLLRSILKPVKVLNSVHDKQNFHQMDGLTILLEVCARKYRCLSHAYLCPAFCGCRY